MLLDRLVRRKQRQPVLLHDIAQYNSAPASGSASTSRNTADDCPNTATFSLDCCLCPSIRFKLSVHLVQVPETQQGAG